MSKKVIGALLALALVLSVFSFTVLAAGTGYETDASFTQTWKLANKQGSGGTYTVDVYLTTNYKVGPIQFKLDNVDSVTAVTVGTGYYKATATPGGTSGLVILTPDSSSNLLGITLNNALVATVTYKSASTATPAIKNDVKSVSNPQGTLMAARLDGDYINSGSFLVGQPATIIGLDGGTTEPPATAAELAKKSTAEAGVVVDTTHTFGGAYDGVVFGFKQKAGATFVSSAYLTNNFEAANGGSLEFSRSIGTRGYGTGTVITVKNSDGTVAEKYVVVIFGDVNGDGFTDTNDTAETKKAASNAKYYADNSIQRMAANCQNVSGIMMHTINSNDTSAVKTNASGKYIDQAALAAKIASLAGTWYK